MCYTLVNVPYGALNASLSRDTREITILTSTRMFMANIGGLAVGYGIPIMVYFFYNHSHPGADHSSFKLTQADGNDWFMTMTAYAVIGLLLLIFCFSQSRERIVMSKKDSVNVKVSDLWVEFCRNRPLRIIAFFFIIAFAMMAIGNAAGAYYINYNLCSDADVLANFMALGSIPAFIFMPMIPGIKARIGKKNMFYVFLTIAVIGMILLYIVSAVDSLRSQIWLVYVAQFIKSTGVIVATGYMWALVPEVISYGEYKHGKRIAGIVNALTGIFYKAGMALGGVVPGFVLALVGFDANAETQSGFAQEGILWLVAVIPAILLIIAMFIISKYELEDDVIEKINAEIELRHQNADTN
jgi:GPH family glycoside/pentoside/hexuronide:cation symporter